MVHSGRVCGQLQASFPTAPQAGGLNSTDKCYLLPVSRTTGFLPLTQAMEPKYFFLRKTFKVQKIYFCHNLEAHSLCDVCYRLNNTLSKMLALHLTMCLWYHLICFGSTFFVCSESESWQRNGNQSPSLYDLELAMQGLCACVCWGWVRRQGDCLPTHLLPFKQFWKSG